MRWLARVAFVLPLAVVATARGDMVHDSPDLNYQLTLPDGFVWGDASPFAAEKAVELANWRIDPLADKDKTPGTGQGMRVILSVQDAPQPPALDADFETWLTKMQLVDGELKLAESAGNPPDAAKVKEYEDLRDKINAALQALAQKPEVLRLLMMRWGKDAKTWPAPEYGTAEIGTIPAAEVRVVAPCANLDGNDGPCKAKMFVWVLRKKMYRLVMWGFPTKRDKEGVRTAMDSIEIQFTHMKKEAIPKKGTPPGPPPTANGGSAPAGDPALDKTETVTVADLGFEVLKPSRFKKNPVDRATNTQRNTGSSFTAQAGVSDANLEVLVYHMGGPSNPWTGPGEWLTGQWAAFVRDHPSPGKMDAGDFPTYGAKTGFLVMPDTTKWKPIKRPPPPPATASAKDKEKELEKEEKASVKEMEEKFAVTEVKNAQIGAVKLKDAFQFCLRGNKPRLGDEIWTQFVFTTNERAFVIRVTIHGEGATLWSKEIGEFLKSFKLLEK